MKLKQMCMLPWAVLSLACRIIFLCVCVWHVCGGSRTTSGISLVYWNGVSLTVREFMSKLDWLSMRQEPPVSSSPLLQLQVPMVTFCTWILGMELESPRIHSRHSPTATYCHSWLFSYGFWESNSEPHDGEAGTSPTKALISLVWDTSVAL